VRQFDVVENPDSETRRYSPFLVVLQSHHLDPIETIFLAPLVSDATRPVSPLDIPLEFQGRRLVTPSVRRPASLEAVSGERWDR
jgi:hypothetical protein